MKLKKTLLVLALFSSIGVIANAVTASSGKRCIYNISGILRYCVVCLGKRVFIHKGTSLSCT